MLKAVGPVCWWVIWRRVTIRPLGELQLDHLTNYMTVSYGRVAVRPLRKLWLDHLGNQDLEPLLVELYWLEQSTFETNLKRSSFVWKMSNQHCKIYNALWEISHFLGHSVAHRGFLAPGARSECPFFLNFFQKISKTDPKQADIIFKSEEQKKRKRKEQQQQQSSDQLIYIHFHEVFKLLHLAFDITPYIVFYIILHLWTFMIWKCAKWLVYILLNIRLTSAPPRVAPWACSPPPKYATKDTNLTFGIYQDNLLWQFLQICIG